jgi:hypothetical protein
MVQLREDDDRRSILFTIFVLLLLSLFLIIAPIEYVDYRFSNITDSKDIADVENSYRSTLAQILGGLFLFTGVFLTWRNVKSTEKHVQLIEASQSGKRFAQALECLVNENMEIRLAGIYDLVNIHSESTFYRKTIVEILAYFIRNKSCVYKEQAKNLGLDVIVSFDFLKYNHSEVGNLDLSGSYLVGVDLYNGDFSFTDLSECTFDKADLSGTNFMEANLKDASFKASILEGVNFYQALLQNADFSDADLLSSDFRNAQLDHAILDKADISDAKLMGADFRFATFKQTEGLSVDEISKVYTLYNSEFDEDMHTYLISKYPDLFKKPDE